jgi:condensin complex subunit 1
MAAFPIPASFTDLERSPYNLLPYPQDFADDDEAARADSFNSLVQLLEQGNRALAKGGMTIFDDSGDGIASSGEWMDEDRMQAMYTLVR